MRHDLQVSDWSDVWRIQEIQVMLSTLSSLCELQELVDP